MSPYYIEKLVKLQILYPDTRPDGDESFCVESLWSTVSHVNKNSIEDAKNDTKNPQYNLTNGRAFCFLEIKAHLSTKLRIRVMVEYYVLFVSISMVFLCCFDPRHT